MSYRILYTLDNLQNIPLDNKEQQKFSKSEIKKGVRTDGDLYVMYNGIPNGSIARFLILWYYGTIASKMDVPKSWLPLIWNSKQYWLHDTNFFCHIYKQKICRDVTVARD